MANVVCLSFETYDVLPVEKNDAVREPGFARCAAAIAPAMPRSFVTSPALWKTAISGACSPVPKIFSVCWFVSYAE